MWEDLKASQPRGSAVEELIEQFCKKSFLQDFLFLRPKTLTSHREITDLIAILDEKCLCIQIKAFGKDFSYTGQRLRNWGIKKFIEAGSQASGATRKIITADTDISADHVWRGNVIFHAGDLIPICGIALVEYLGPPFTLPNDIKHKTTNGIPIHYFSLNDFLNMVDLLATLPDIIEYLRQRASISDDLRSIIGKERDLYAFYLLNGHLQPELHYRDIENKWSYMIDVEKEAFERKRKHDIFVVFYNGLIDEAHNRDPNSHSYRPPELIKYLKSKSDKTSYLEIATRLNKLPYIYRREIGKHLFQVSKDVKSDGEIRMFTYPNLGQPWVLTFLVTPKINRTLRIRKLHLLVASVQVSYGCQSIIGIACPSLDSNQGFDYIFADKITYNEEEIRKFGPYIKKRNLVSVNVFPDIGENSCLPKDEDFN